MRCISLKFRPLDRSRNTARATPPPVPVVLCPSYCAQKRDGRTRRRAGEPGHSNSAQEAHVHCGGELGWCGGGGTSHARRTSATAEISISAPLSTHALRSCATSPQGSDGVEEEARHLHTSHRIASHTKRPHTPTFPLADLPVSRSRSAADRSPFVRQDAPDEDELGPGLEKQAAVGRKRRAPSSSPPPRDGRREMGRASGVSDEVRCAKCGSKHTQRWGWDGDMLCEACYLASNTPGAAATKWRVGDRVHARHGSVRSMSLARRSLRGRPQPERLTRCLRAALRGPSG